MSLLNFERALRVYKLTDELASLRPLREIVRSYAEAWEMPESYVRQLIQEAYLTLSQLATLGRSERREQIVEAWQVLYRQAVEQSDLKCAAQCLDRLTKLEGYYAAAEQKLDKSTLGPGNPDAVRARTKELLQTETIKAKVGTAAEGNN